MLMIAGALGTDRYSSSATETVTSAFLTWLARIIPPPRCFNRSSRFLEDSMGNSLIASDFVRSVDVPSYSFFFSYF